MAEHPIVREGDWLNVGNTRCVVMEVYQTNSHSGVCKVVFNRNKPTTQDVDWNGKEWIFPVRPDFGGYAQSSNQYVQQLLGKR